MMPLSILLRQLDFSCDYRAEDLQISDIAYDSRKVRSGSIFVAIRGKRFDGHDYIPDAFSRGAVICFCEKAPQHKYPHILVNDSRRALAELSYAYYCPQGLPYPLIGVTGTNGKTTITHLLYQLAETAGLHPALIGTLGVRSEKHIEEGERTTPESRDLAEHFRDFAKNDVSAAFMEVSSHAIALKRVYGLAFDAAVFTNLTRDHLDFHGNMENYFQSKAALFRQIKENGYALINRQDPYGRRLAKELSEPVYTYAVSDEQADFYFTEMNVSIHGVRGIFHTPDKAIKVDAPLLGHFNAENIAAALSCWHLCFPQLRNVSDAFNFQPVAGRMERISTKRGTAVIDYAHTPDAMEKALQAAQQLEGIGHIITVFGCGGDRDQGKRPQMGAVAERYSNHIILSNDNPRNEEPENIIADILSGIKQKDKVDICIDRGEALHKAYAMSEPGDLLMVLGKGAENYMEIKGHRIPFQDKKTILGLE